MKRLRIPRSVDMHLNTRWKRSHRTKQSYHVFLSTGSRTTWSYRKLGLCDYINTVFPLIACVLRQETHSKMTIWHRRNSQRESLIVTAAQLLLFGNKGGSQWIKLLCTRTVTKELQKYWQADVLHLIQLCHQTWNLASLMAIVTHDNYVTKHFSGASLIK